MMEYDIHTYNNIDVTLYVIGLLAIYLLDILLFGRNTFKAEWIGTIPKKLIKLAKSKSAGPFTADEVVTYFERGLF